MNYIISFTNDTKPEHVAEYMEHNGIIITEHLSNLGHIYVTESVNVPAPDNNIDYIVENDLTKINLMSTNCIEISTDNDENWWKLSTINIENFDTPTIVHCKNEMAVNVYVMDSGITADHEEFNTVNIENIYSYDGTFVDTTGHGTAVASVIAGKTLSLANVNLKIVKVFGESDTYVIHLLRALDAIIGSAKQSDAISIVNISWTIPKYTFFDSQIEKLFKNNILVVCAAGNNNLDINFLSPTSIPNTLTVGAYDEHFRPCDFTALSGMTIGTGWSNHGLVDVWAPGMNIKVANYQGGYLLSNGTSLASAVHTNSVAHALGSYFNTGSVSIKNFNLYMSVASALSAYNFGLVDFRETDGRYYNVTTARTSTIKSQIHQATDVLVSSNNKFFVINNFTTFNKCILTTAIDEIISVTGLPNGLSLTDGWLVGKPQIEFPPESVDDPSTTVTELTFDATIQYTAINKSDTYTLPITIVVRRKIK